MIHDCVLHNRYYHLTPLFIFPFLLIYAYRPLCESEPHQSGRKSSVDLLLLKTHKIWLKNKTHQPKIPSKHVSNVIFCARQRLKIKVLSLHVNHIAVIHTCFSRLPASCRLDIQCHITVGFSRRQLPFHITSYNNKTLP